MTRLEVMLCEKSYNMQRIDPETADFYMKNRTDWLYWTCNRSVLYDVSHKAPQIGVNGRSVPRNGAAQRKRGRCQANSSGFASKRNGGLGALLATSNKPHPSRSRTCSPRPDRCRVRRPKCPIPVSSPAASLIRPSVN